MPITRKIAVAGAAAIVASLTLAGCSSGLMSGAPAGDRSKATSATRSSSAAPTTSAAAPKGDPSATASTDLSFADGAELPSSALPAFGVQLSGLPTWRQTGSDPAKGSTEYTNDDGAVATFTQQHITDLDPSLGDEAATVQLFTASGYPAQQLEKQLLPTMSGGTAEFLSIGGHDTSGAWSATVARAFSKPGAALIVKVSTPSEAALHEDLHEILINAQVLTV